MVRKKPIFFIILLALATVGVILFFGAKKQIPSSNENPYDPNTGGPGKKKILIFTSRGGGGHLSISNALYNYLKEDYTMGSTLVFSEILGDLDPLNMMSENGYGGEDWYNYLIKQKWNRAIKLTYDLGSWYFHARRKKSEQLIEDYLRKTKPDLLISVIPIINNILITVAERLNIPFLLVPPDLDATTSMNDIHKPTYKKFYLAMSFNDADINKTIEPAQIPASQIYYVGFPVRIDFFRPHNENSIKKDFDVPQGKPVILLLMGGQGSQELYEFSRQLTKLTIPAHIIIAIGKSEHLRKQLSHIIFPSHVTRSIVSFTPRIPDLMAISDILITKPGPVSICEAIYAHLPMLIDYTSTPITWEELNAKFATSHDVGFLIKRSYQIPTLVAKMISNSHERAAMQKQFSKLTKQNPEHEIKALVRKILKDEKK